MTAYADVLRVCGGAVLAFVCVQVLRAYDRGGGMGSAASACFSVLFAVFAVTAAVPLLTMLREKTEPYLHAEYAEILWRAMAVGMTVQLTADMIRDAGESALAEKIDMIGRAALLCIGLPLYEAIFDLAAALLQVGQG